MTIKNYAGTVLFAPDGPLYGDTYDMAWIVNTEGIDPDSLAAGVATTGRRTARTPISTATRPSTRYMKDAQLHYDQARRRHDYEQAWKIMLAEAPSVMIYWDHVVVGANSDLKNFKPSPVVTDYWNAWEWTI